MSQPIVIAYHLVWTTYGSWLPNDPRGSHSMTGFTTTCSPNSVNSTMVARKSSPRAVRSATFIDAPAPLLQHPLLTFDEPARAEIAAAFGDEIEKQCYTCWAYAVMPDHIHPIAKPQAARG